MPIFSTNSIAVEHKRHHNLGASWAERNFLCSHHSEVELINSTAYTMISKYRLGLYKAKRVHDATLCSPAENLLLVQRNSIGLSGQSVTCVCVCVCACACACACD